ncbi:MULTISPECIES: hypothetical protein [Pseudomonas]|jgi:hypothetical protein|uniref:hypothetical protein n=1 Tax=Pseudomonas brassicacearum TaxID=930166 RepID=UPI0005191388|nr:hypothetical protein [Pseudomonas brassicacearum]RDI07553.1 hypothetical protein DFO59_102359 [Pseudomonas fluorescens]ROM86475.1 hypothetical protein BK655_08410 [Pseudomonas brassicacearum]WLG70637.1 hypothetical protein PSH71_12755 [Pseudomonas brassicacearum]SDP35035.1 hypothetical protein SAMN04490180_1070 [Pseudomonas brassicacearum]
MSKILFISLNVLKTLGLPLVLSGCFVAQNLEEQVFLYELRIVNKLAVPIAYCEDFEATSCPNVVQSGGSEREIFSSYVENRTDEEKLRSFNRQKIKICGKLVELKLISSVSPVVKHDKDHFEIIIDTSVSDTFCQSEVSG